MAAGRVFFAPSLPFGWIDRAAVAQPADRPHAGCCRPSIRPRPGRPARDRRGVLQSVLSGGRRATPRSTGCSSGAGGEATAPASTPKAGAGHRRRCWCRSPALMLPRGDARALSGTAGRCARRRSLALRAAARDPVDTVLFQIRLPRVLAAIAGRRGAGRRPAPPIRRLFRNPLVSPDILGVSAGRGLRRGAWHPVGAAGRRHPAAGLRRRARDRRHGLPASPGRCAAARCPGAGAGGHRGRRACRRGISLVKVLADPYNQLPAITFWLLGSLAGIKAARRRRSSCRWCCSAWCRCCCCAGGSACCRWATTRRRALGVNVGASARRRDRRGHAHHRQRGRHFAA